MFMIVGIEDPARPPLLTPGESQKALTVVPPDPDGAGVGTERLRCCLQQRGGMLDRAFRRQRSRLVFVYVFAYAEIMYATAVVRGKVVRFKLSPALARAHRENRRRSMTERDAVAFVEEKRRARALHRAKPYLESRP